ncbi:hypothetical protein OAT18_02780 [Tenacibaculum sp.]|nr:hypothetical protein [Tenacibaculum sp.]
MMLIIKNIQSSIPLFIAIFCVLFSYKINSQELSLIDNKGTIKLVNNNSVTTAGIAPTSPVENDIWFDTNSTPASIKIWNGTTWVSMEHSGTNGSIFFAGSDGRPTENNAQLRWNNTTNRLSIGTPLSGTNKVTVQGAIRATAFNNASGTAGLPSYRFSNDSDTGMYRFATNQLGFTTAGINALIIDALQNVLIGKNLTVTGSYIDTSGDVGTAGQILSSTVTGTDWIDINTAAVVNKTADYTLILSDNGKVFTFNSSSDVTLTIPAALPIGYNISVYQIGTGKVIITGDTGVNVLNRLSRFKTAGKDAGVGVIATSLNTFHLTGDLKK